MLGTDSAKNKKVEFVAGRYLHSAELWRCPKIFAYCFHKLYTQKRRWILYRKHEVKSLVILLFHLYFQKHGLSSIQMKVLVETLHLMSLRIINVCYLREKWWKFGEMKRGNQYQLKFDSWDSSGLRNFLPQTKWKNIRIKDFFHILRATQRTKLETENYNKNEACQKDSVFIQRIARNITIVRKDYTRFLAFTWASAEAFYDIMQKQVALQMFRKSLLSPSPRRTYYVMVFANTYSSRPPFWCRQ